MIEDIAAYIIARTAYGFLLSQFHALTFGWLGRMLLWVHSIGSGLLTLHLMWLGYQLITGRASSSVTVRVTDSLRAAVILGLAMGTTIGGATLFQWLGGDLVRAIAALVHGGDGDLLGEIDRNFGYTQLALGSIGEIIAPNAEIQAAKDWNMAFVTWGIGGPGLVGMAMLLVFQITLSLFVGFAPFFVLCLIWRRTRPLFDNWLLYGLGTMFAMATLAVMLEMTLPMVGAVAAAFWTATWTGANPEGVNSLAMQQGGLGLILTTMIISAPVIAAKFFKATLGDFVPFSAFMNRMEDRKAAAQSAHAGSSHAYTPERDHAPVPTHAHRVVVPVQVQADEVKKAEDSRSFLERYPNATASLGNRSGSGDKLPKNLAKVRDADETGALNVKAGLGDPVDRLIGLSLTLQREVSQLQKAGWEIRYGETGRGSMTNRGNHPTILIDGRWEGNDKETFRALVHEIGHAGYQYRPNYSSRDAYINGALCDEAAAMVKNIQIRREILESSQGKTDIGLNGTATNHGKYNEAYDQYLTDQDDAKLRASIGTVFGDHEYVSVRKGAKKTYREYYGEEYDARHGR